MNYDRAQLDDLAALAETPAWILKPDTFRANYLALRDAFRAIYPGTDLAYSYKTNYVPELCRIVDAEGGWAEVVSKMEFRLARKLGVEPDRILLNGPGKKNDCLDEALDAGAVVNLDSLGEVDHVVGRDKPVDRIGLRVNLTGAGDLPPSRFGLSVADGEFDEALARLKTAGVMLEGLHAHLMVPGKTAAGYGAVSEALLELFASRFGSKGLRWIDVGGGFAGPMPDPLAAQFDTPPPSFADYAAAVAGPFAARFPDGGPLLLLEPGIALAADAVDYVARVVDTKTVAGRTIACADGSVYDLKPTLNTVNLPLTRVPGAGEERPGPAEVTGATCMEHDILQRDHAGPVAAGDYLVFGNAGAYTIVLRPPFIRPTPAIVAREDDRWRIVRRKGDLAEVFGPYGLTGPRKDGR